MKSERLSKLKSICSSCKRCPLYEDRNKVVFGEGNPDAPLMFIGEAPGAEENSSGRPFVGRAGKLLRKLISAIGMAPEDEYIANILKCRPPGNRTPEREEIGACLPYLRKQIEIIQPKMLVLLGKTAVTGLIPEYAGWGMNSLREKSKETMIRFSGIPVMITYHPSAILRRKEWKKYAAEDFHYLEQIRKDFPETVIENSVKVESLSLFP